MESAKEDPLGEMITGFVGMSVPDAERLNTGVVVCFATGRTGTADSDFCAGAIAT